MPTTLWLATVPTSTLRQRKLTRLPSSQVNYGCQPIVPLRPLIRPAQRHFEFALLGSSIQYDKELWITPDLWGMQDYPSHSVEEYRSSLLLAYHMGADAIYKENLAYDGAGKGKAA